MSTLRQKHQAGQFTITVELDPPKSSSAQKTFDEAARLYGKVDAINIADCPMSRMRMSPIALSHLLMHHEHIETIFHLTCRDRNIIGLQSELLGAAALGVNNILTLTGDQPGRGDHPQAKPVFEINSMGLAKVATQLNNGYDFMGNELDECTHFYIGTSANPGAANIENEITRLRAKKEAGAQFVQTQPIYDLDKAEYFTEQVADLNMPILLGLIPLKSFKMAMYLHDKVPGISLTQDILDRMEQGGKQAGLEIALETLKKIQKIASGVHIMPLNDIDTVLYLIEHM